MAVQQAEMRMVRWMCDVKVKDIVPSKELRLGLDDVISGLQVAVVRACVAKRRQQLGEEMYAVCSREYQIKR